SACSRLCGHVVTCREPEREGGAAAHLALDANRAVELFDNAFRDCKAEAEAAALGRDEIVEDCGETLRGYAGSSVDDAHLDVVADTGRRDCDPAARLGGLNRVGNQVAVHAAEREAVAFDDERAGRVVRLDG